jgi:DNA ligase-4
MLAKRVSFGECTRAMDDHAFVIEPKLDGERITCHIKWITENNHKNEDDDDAHDEEKDNIMDKRSQQPHDENDQTQRQERSMVQFLSRNGTNYTDMYGPCMTNYIINATQVMSASVDCILDGEMLVWDNQAYRFQPFGSIKTIALQQTAQAQEKTTRYAVKNIIVRRVFIRMKYRPFSMSSVKVFPMQV